MPLINKTDFLYLPKVPMLNNGVMGEGFLVITSQHIIQVPHHTLEFTKEHWLDRVTTMSTTRFNAFEGVPFWEIIPKAAETETSNNEFAQFVLEVAKTHANSIIIPFTDVAGYKFGFFAAFTVITSTGKTRFPVGGRRKEVELYLRQKSKLLMG